MQANKQMRILIRGIRAKQEQMELLERQINADKQELMQLLDEAQDDEATYKYDGELIKSKIVESTKVIFNADALLRKFGSRRYKRLCESQVDVDKGELREIFQNNPDVKEILRPAITISHIPSDDKINEAIQNDIVTMAELKGCYETKVTRYVRFTGTKLQE